MYSLLIEYFFVKSMCGFSNIYWIMIIIATSKIKKRESTLQQERQARQRVINTRQTVLGQGPPIMLFVTNEPGFVKQTVKTNTLLSASGTAILEVSDIPRNERRQNKRTKDECVVAWKREHGMLAAKCNSRQEAVM